MKKYAMRLLALCLFAAMILSACAPAATQEPQATETPAATQEPQAADTPAPEATQEPAKEPEAAITGEEATAEMFAAMEERSKAYAPEVITLESGVQVQRTPDDVGGYWHRPGNTTGYNTYYLNADECGCASCHGGDLSKLLQSMEYEHLYFQNEYDFDMTVLDCRHCHTYGDGYLYKTNQLGALIHGIHTKETFTGDCMTCHTATEDGQGLLLWEEAKYDVLQGISFLSDVQGEFRYDQDVLTSAEGAFFANWSTGESDYERNGNAMANVPLDEELFNKWEIEVCGEVENPFTITLGELIEQAPSVTQVAANQCVMNPVGGAWIMNCEVTGIPLSWLLEKAILKDSAKAFLSYDPQGWNRGLPLSALEEYDAMLVYEINGERLPWGQGYPLTTWTPGYAAPSFIRRVCKIEVVSNENVKVFDGWPAPAGTDIETGTYINKANAGIYHFHEGQIIKAGEPYTFEGFAHGFDQQVVAVEFSLDRGKTWTRFDTSDSDRSKWIYWYFTYTPETPGAYVLSVRAETAEGLVTYYPDEVMFNAK